MTFRRNYEELHFSVLYLDGSGGLVASSSEWDIRILAIVPELELNEWTNGLKVATEPESGWIKELPKAPQDLTPYKWYEAKGVIVGINQEKRTVLYRNYAF